MQLVTPRPYIISFFSYLTGKIHEQKILGSHSGIAEESNVLVCYAVSNGK